MDLDADVFGSSFLKDWVEWVPEETVIFVDDGGMSKRHCICNAVADSEAFWVGNVRGEQFAWVEVLVVSSHV